MLTPTEVQAARIAARIADLEAQLQLSEERNFYLVAEVARLTADEARLDWLEKTGADVEKRYHTGSLGPGWAVWTDDGVTKEHPTVRAALDAAIAETKPKA